MLTIRASQGAYPTRNTFADLTALKLEDSTTFGRYHPVTP